MRTSLRKLETWIDGFYRPSAVTPGFASNQFIRVDGVDGALRLTVLVRISNITLRDIADIAISQIREDRKMYKTFLG